MTVVDRYEQNNEPDSEHRIDPATLDWVREEIESTIAQSTEALDAYAAAPTDPTPLRLTGSQLHQVGGTLQMVELDGAARLAGEVERLLDGIVRGDVEGNEVALDLVRSGLNTLSSHLDDLRLGGYHIPLRLLPTINQLRVGRSAEPVDPLELFSPDLSISPPAHTERVHLDDEDALQEVAEAARRDFQSSLLTWLRNPGDSAPLDTMIDVLDRLWAHTRMPSASQSWWIGAALVESFRDANKEIDKDAKSLLGRLDQRIRLLGDEGEAALVSDRAEDLAGRMLYEIALAEKRGERALEVAREYRLRELLGEDIDVVVCVAVNAHT